LTANKGDDNNSLEEQGPATGNNGGKRIRNDGASKRIREQLSQWNPVSCFDDDNNGEDAGELSLLSSWNRCENQRRNPFNRRPATTTTTFFNNDDDVLVSLGRRRP